ncbi:putative sugar O-methyltransferase [Chloroflexota bacterium]
MLPELKKQQSKQGELHQSSSIERWLDWEVSAFGDMAMLAKFRCNYLCSGTMDWPCRPPAYRLKYKNENDGAAVLNPEFFSLARKVSPVISKSYWLDKMRGKKWLRSEFIKSRQALGSSDGDWFSDNLVGQPFHIKVNGRIVTEPLIRHGYYIRQLLSLFPAICHEPLIIFEIGGGYGSLARFLKRLNPNIKVILTDLPERIALQYYYLSESFRNIDIAVAVVTGNVLDLNADFILLPTWKLPMLSEASIDLVINTHSMQEMTLEQVAYYVEHIERVTKHTFYCVNRYEKKIGYQIIRYPAEQVGSKWHIVYDAPEPSNDAIREVMLIRR